MVAPTESKLNNLHLKKSKIPGLEDLLHVLNSSQLAYFLIFMVSMAGAALVFYATRLGPWVFSDSVDYLDVARSIIQGYGLGSYGPSGKFHLLLHFPPGYPLLLAFFGNFSRDLVAVSRWIDIVLFGLTIWWLGYVTYRLTHTTIFAFSLALLTCMSPALIMVFTGAMSEAPSIFTGVLALGLMLLYITKPSPWLLLAAALAAGFAAITRYAALAYPAAGAVALVLFHHSNWKKRLGDTTVFCLVSGTVVLSWLTWVYLNSERIGNRSLSFSGLRDAFAQFRFEVSYTIWAWLPLVSQNVHHRIKLGFVLGLLALLPCIYVAIRMLRRRQNNQLAGAVHLAQALSPLEIGGVFLVFSAAYISTLAGAYVFTSPTPAINDRMLSPLYMALVVVFFSMTFGFIPILTPATRWRRAAQTLTFLVAVLYAGWNYPQAYRLVNDLHKDSFFGYTSPLWQNSSTIHAIRRLPDNMTIITNEAAPVLFLTGRPAYQLKEIYREKPLPVFTHFTEDDGNDYQLVFQKNEAALVLFNSFYYQLEHLYFSEVPHRLEVLTEDLFIYQQLDDGVIYFSQQVNFPESGEQ